MQPEESPILFSFLTPTRKRPDLVARLFQSIVDTTARLDELEIILAVDHDDEASLNISDDRLRVKKVVLRERLTMGALNNACFDASSGRYVMIMNDDVILRTKNWDQTVRNIFAGYGDEIGLVHVNDLLFKEKLCTFPILSRRACLAIGLCPEKYRRYKIDDHIYDIYNMLAFMGHKRIAYLPDVVFEHENHEASTDGTNKHAFAAAMGKVYVPKKAIIEQDDETYLDKLDERKEAALKLAGIIDADARRARRERKEAIYQGRLNAIQAKDPYRYRHRSFVTTVLSGRSKPRDTARTTVAIVTADMRGEHPRRCIESVKAHTSNYDLVILDNNRGGEFSHPREMNKVLATATTDFVVLLDDDVFVKPGWLEGMLRCVDEKTGAVTPMHKDEKGGLSYSGIYLAGDGKGTHDHTLDRPEGPRPMQCYCSAALLIDMRKCGHLRMDETYRKYFFDLVHGLQVWEAGYKAVCAADVAVTHLGGATTVRGSEMSDHLWAQDHDLFIANWVRSGRLDALADGIWQQYPYIKSLADIPRGICRVLEEASHTDLPGLKREMTELMLVAADYPLFGRLMEIKLIRCLRDMAEARDDARFGLCLSCLILLKKTSGRLHEMMDLNGFLVQNGRADFAATVAQAMLTIAPRDPVVWKRFGANQYLLGELAASKEAYERAHALDKTDANTLVSLAKVCMQQAEFQQALDHFAAAAQADPNDGEAQVGLAVTAHHFKNKPVFRSAYRRAKELQPGHPTLKKLAREARAAPELARA